MTGTAENLAKYVRTRAEVQRTEFHAEENVQLEELEAL
jgi:hypothetical protein